MVAENLDFGPTKQAYLHLIHVDAEVQDLEASSKLNAEWDYLTLLFDRGRRWADMWLEENYDQIGVASTFDLDELFGEPKQRPKGTTRLARMFRRRA